MLIYVCEDICQTALNGRMPNHECALSTICELVYGCGKGHHYVHVANFQSYKSNLFAHKTFPHSYVSNIEDCSKHLNFFALLDKLDWVVVVSFNQDTQYLPEKIKDKNIIFVNPITNSSLELYEETHLIAENLKDTVIFQAIANNMLRNKSFGSKVGICVMPRNGGGKTIDTVVDVETKSNPNHFCLIITDSDKNYPDENKIGETAQAVKNVLDKNKCGFVHFYHMTQVRELENIIPHNLLLSALPHSDRRLKEVAKGNLSFYDIKIGLKVSMLKNDNEYLYYFNDLSDKVSTEIKHYNEYSDDEKNDNISVLPGWGKAFVSEFIKKHENLRQLSIISLEKLTTDQRHEWVEISRRIINWGLCRKRARL